MSDEFSRGPRGQGRRPPGGRRRPGSRPSFDDLDDEEPREEAGGFEDDFEDEDRPARRPARQRPRPGGRAAAAKKRGSSWSLFGGRKETRVRRPRRDDRMDWDEAQEEEYDDSEGRYDREGASDEYDEPRPRRRHAPPREGKRRERLTLMELCTPVFGYAAVLPRDAGGIQPGYQQFRQEVLNALQRIESEAPQHGIEREDATKAAYALSLFMDEQVGESEWTGKMQWIGEPLSIMKLQDPEGGINFFNILDSLGERQKAVKEVFLVCLSLGFRGKYAEIEDITQQSARIAEVRQKVLRTIHPSPLESRRLLFPEAYTEAIPLEDEAPPPPRWWVAASMATVAVCVLIYVLLFWSAINAPNSADAALKKVLAGEVSQ